MQETAQKTKLTHEQYFALEEKSDTRHEYYQGEIFNLAGGSINHNRIIRNFSHYAIDKIKDHSCEVLFTDIKIWIESADLFTYPDILIICGQAQFYKNRDDVVLNPVLIAEVLSKSTKNYDRGEKFLFYRQIPSLKHYLLIDQYSPHVEYFYLNEDGHWVLSEFSDLHDRLEIRRPDFSLGLQDIYRGVSFKKEKNRVKSGNKVD